MGYDFAAYDGPVPATNAEAMMVLNSMDNWLQGEPTPPTERLQAYLDELKQVWPGDTDEELEASPWKAWPLEMDASGPLFYTSLRWSKARAFLKMAEIGLRHGLVVIDPESGQLLNDHDEPRMKPFWRRKRS